QFKGSKGVSEEELKGMMQQVPLEEVYIEALQETFSIKQCTRDKEKELWVEIKRLFELDSEDQLWTYHQAFLHDPLDWKLYDTCGVHHVSTKKNQEIIMLVEKDYPLRKGLATVMILQDEELFEASSLGTSKGPKSESSARKKGRTVAIIMKDVQKRRNDVKARTTLLLALPDEHQLRFSKYETAKELWESILKTFGGNEATKKTKKNQLKLQYGNFKTEGSKTLEQTFNRLQAIMSHLEFMDVEIEHDDLNQKFVTSLAPEWLMYTIVWRNRDALDIMSLDDVYNHLKVYEPEVQKRSESNSQNMAFISSSNTSSGKGKVHIGSVPTTSTQVSTASTDVAAASLSHDTICAYIATQSNGSQIKYEDITQINEDDIEEMDIKWNMALLSMRADRGLSQVEARLVEFKENEVKYCERIRVLDRDVEIRDNKIEYLKNGLEQIKKEKSLDKKLTGFENASKDLDNLLGSQRSYKNKEGLRYSAVHPLPAQIYSPPKKDLSWTGLPEFVDDTVSDYCSIMSKPKIKFMKEADYPRVIKINNTKNARKSTVKYAEMYRNISKVPKVRGNQQNWNNLKSQQLGKDFLMQNKACFKCGYFDHLAFNCGVWVDNGETWPKDNYAHKTYSNVKRSFQRKSAVRNQPRVPRVSIVTEKIPTVDSKFPTAKSTLTADLGDKGKVVKASARYWDIGCSRHMTGNISYLFEYEPSDGGYVSFGHGGGKITGKDIVIKNKAMLVTQGYTQEEGVDYEEVFAPVTRIEAIRLFLAYASFMGFIVYHMDVKSASLYGNINEEVYVMQPPRFQDPEFPKRVYKVEKAMYGLHQAPRAWYGTLFKEFEALMHDKFQKSAMGELTFFLGLQVLQKKDGNFISQDKYVGDILKKFRYSDVRHQVIPKECHLHAVKRIFRYLKGHPKLGLWYPKESPFDLEAYSDSDYGGATQDKKSTTGGCQFLGRRLISWQCKKQTIVATSITKTEYVAAASGCGQVLWIQNQMLDYGIKTTNQETKIIATVDRKPRTISESSLRRHLKLNDEEGISSLPDAELFENLSLMGYNILPSQRFTFQKGQFSHQWKSRIHTIMQCLSPKSTGFNEFSSNIATAVVCLATNSVYNFSKMIFDGMMRNINSKGTKFLMYPRFISKCFKMGQFGKIAHTNTYLVSFHTRKVFTILRVNNPSFSGRTVPLFASMIVTQGESLANPTEPNHTPSPQEHQSPKSNYSSQHDSPPLSHQTIILEPIPHDLQAPIETLTPRRLPNRGIRIAQSKALSPDADEPASLSRDDRHKKAFPTVSSLDAGQDRENIAKTSAMSHESGNIGEELGADKSTEKGSNDTEEMVNVLSSMEAVNILPSGGAAFSTTSVFRADVFPTAGVPTVSGSFPTVSAIFTTTSVEHIDAQVDREMEEEFTRENQRLSEQAARDSEITRIHAEEELKLMIEGLDRSNEINAKHLSEYEQGEADLSVGEKIKLISELVKYQDYLAKILKYQAQQSKPSSKKEQRKFYMSILKSHAGWKTKHFRGMTLEQIKEKFISVWKHLQDFEPMSSKEESEKVKRSGIKLDQGSSKRVKISHTSRSKPSQEKQFKGSKGVFEEELKRMMQLVPLEEVYIEALQQFDREDLHQLWILVKETFSIKQSTRDKEKELWVELKRLFVTYSEDQLWTYHQAFMHDPLHWKLYDTCGVHHVSTKKNQEIFMLVEKDYPLFTVMISNKLQVKQYSQMASDLLLKIYNITNTPR
nr:hypothetical protein [Tanacetum cinerariifolium]